MVVAMIRKPKSKQSMGLKLDVPSGFFLTWYTKRGRAFPWRERGVSPYGILLAEILLRQTRAEMVARVWPLLIREYPDANALAAARPTRLLAIVEGLGFGKQRTQALIELGASIKPMGKLPSEPEELMALPHVGLYTAHAVACFGFGRRVPVVDLNVVRVISRFAGIEAPKDIRRRADCVWQIAGSLLPLRRVPEHNYGLLDFAATICKPRSPACFQCPIATRCEFQKMRDSQLTETEAR